MSRVLCAILMAVTSGCAAIAGFEDLTQSCPAENAACASGGRGGNDSGVTGNVHALCDPREVPCVTERGPSMAKITRRDGTHFWMDTTEVTRGQYRAYEASQPEPRDDALCSGSPSFGSQLSDGCRSMLAADAGTSDALPRTCVDWCNAHDFCVWAGKALCRDDAQAVAPADLLRESDYYAACSEDGTRVGAAAASCETTLCNVPQAHFGGVQDAGASQECYALAADRKTRIFDLIGNVAEWTDACRLESADGECVTRGGSFDELACCDEKSFSPRRWAYTTLGFRCCYYPPRLAE